MIELELSGSSLYKAYSTRIPSVPVIHLEPGGVQFTLNVLVQASHLRSEVSGLKPVNHPPHWLPHYY